MPPRLERLPEIERVEVGNREVVEAHAVAGISLHQRAIVFDGLFVVASDQGIVIAEGPVALALGHPIGQ